MTEHHRPGPNPRTRNARPEEEPSPATVERIVGEVRRKGGRPSMSVPGGESPVLNLRMPREMRDQLDAVAAQVGKRPSAVARDAVAEYLARHAG